MPPDPLAAPACRRQKPGMPSVLRSPALWLGIWLGVGLFAFAPGGRADAEASGKNEAASTEHPLATQAAMDTLKRGGNAADAAAAAALVAGVVGPKSSGIGGGGFAMVLRARAAEPEILDFRETAPAAVDSAALAKRPLPWESRGKLTGVPGEPQGLFDVVRRYGKRPWAELVGTAERIASRGYPVSAFLAEALAEKSAAELKKEPSIAALFFPGGRPAIAGRLVRNPKLAATLKRLGAEGPGAIYDGAIAQEIVSTAASAGGNLSLDDLKRYKVIDRKPIRVRFGDYTVFTMPPPSAGGLLLAQTLGMFAPRELEQLGWGTGAFSHILAESFRASFADRFRYVGDPDFVPVDTAKLLDPARLAKIKKQLSMDRTHRVQRFTSEEHGTHHMVFVDSEGMVVSLTTTVNRSFGAKLVTPNSGIFLNDELDDFDKPSEYARLGIANGANLPRPFARPTSSMTPTVVLRDGRPVLALGGSGGMTIATNVAQLLIGRLVFELTPEELVKQPRFLVSTRDATLFLEQSAAPTLSADLVRRGEIIESTNFATGVQIVTGAPGSLEAAADPRKQGSAQTR